MRYMLAEVTPMKSLSVAADGDEDEALLARRTLRPRFVHHAWEAG